MIVMADEWLKSGEIGLLPYGKPTIEDAKYFFDFTNTIYDKICNILKGKD